jgi:hypothetical protein
VWRTFKTSRETYTEEATDISMTNHSFHESERDRQFEDIFGEKEKGTL